MAPVISSQRLVPIRPSPLKSASSEKSTIGTVSCGSTAMKTGAKRKLSDLGVQDGGKCKRQNTGGNKSSQPSTMGRRNARERNRVKQVNNSFVTLRQHIPGAAKAKKISKVETLKQATDYIRNLQRLLEEHDTMLDMEENNQLLESQMSPVMKREAPQQYMQVPNLTAPEGSTVPQQENIQSPEEANVYSQYYYSENISPVSPTVYPINTVNQVPSTAAEVPAFKPEMKITTAATFPTGVNQQQTIYSNVLTPTTPVSQMSFSLPQTPSYSTPPAAYPVSVAYSPNSIPTQSPNPGSTYSPGAFPISPSSSPATANVPNISPVYSQSYEETKPSLIQARNFIIPASELPYCFPTDMTSIDIDKATATTNADLELLDAIAFWQDC